jgi:hypothetical protein
VMWQFTAAERMSEACARFGFRDRRERVVHKRIAGRRHPSHAGRGRASQDRRCACSPGVRLRRGRVDHRAGRDPAGARRFRSGPGSCTVSRAERRPSPTSARQRGCALVAALVTEARSRACTARATAALAGRAVRDGVRRRGSGFSHALRQVRGRARPLRGRGRRVRAHGSLSRSRRNR